MIVNVNASISWPHLQENPFKNGKIMEIMRWKKYHQSTSLLSLAQALPFNIYTPNHSYNACGYLVYLNKID